MTRPTKRECRHRIVVPTLAVYYERGTRAERGRLDGRAINGRCLRAVEVRRCIDCNEMLPLGPSDETDPRVALEIRAQEIANPQPRHIYSTQRLSVIELAGWEGRETIDLIAHREGEKERHDGVPLNLDSAGWKAGHLARHIAIGHDAEQAGEES